MTFERFAACVREWRASMTPAQVRSAATSILPIVELPRGTTVDAALHAVAAGRAPVSSAAPVLKPRKVLRKRQGVQPSPRALPLVRAQLAHGPKPGEDILAAADFASIRRAR